MSTSATEELLIADISAFFFTNIDEFIVLIVYMAQTGVGKGISLRQVCFGTVLGFTLIMSLSLLGLVLGEFIQPRYMGISGFLPLLYGVYALGQKIWNFFLGEEEEEQVPCESTPRPQAAENTSPQGEKGETSHEEVKDGNEAAVQARSVGPEERNEGIDIVMRKLSSRLNILRKISSNTFDDFIPTVSLPRSKEIPTEERPTIIHFYPTDAHIFDLEKADGGCKCWETTKAWIKKHENLFAIISVAITTCANSGDNVAIYLPLIAKSSVLEVMILLGIFYFLLMMLIVLAWSMTGCQIIADKLKKYGEWIMPFPIMGIGIYILWSSVVFGH